MWLSLIIVGLRMPRRVRVVVVIVVGIITIRQVIKTKKFSVMYHIHLGSLGKGATHFLIFL